MAIVLDNLEFSSDKPVNAMRLKEIAIIFTTVLKVISAAK